MSSKYALRALQSLATESREKFVRVEWLSRKAGVPGPYLSKIMKLLAKRGIVESRRGLTGGVRIAPNRKPISFYEVCEALEDPVVHQKCIISKSACNAGSPCARHEEWQKVRARITAFLRKATL